MKTRQYGHLTILFFILVFLAKSLSAEVRSGFWLFQEPAADSLNRVDFSRLVASQYSPISRNNPDSGIAADCIFRNGHVVAPNGIYYDSTLSSRCDSLITGKMIGCAYTDIFYLDSMMKRLQVHTPTGGTYVDSTVNNRDCSVFFVRTSENRYAVLFRVGEYVGGINRTWYYWAYHPDAAAVLFKQQIFVSPEPMELKIELNVFSGRPNPVFVLDDTAAVLAITHAAFASINTLFDSTMQTAGVLECPGRAGYGGLSVSGGFKIDNRYSDFLPTFRICSGNIVLLHAKEWLSEIAPLFAKDKNGSLERLVISYCCEQNLSVTDQYGTLLFRDLVPDSLKPGLTAQRHSRCTSRTLRNTGPSVAVHGKILLLSGAQTVRSIDIFSLAGERTHSFNCSGGETVSFGIPDVNNRCFLVVLRHSDGSRKRIPTIAIH